MIPKKGETVRLAASVTLAEFGLALCDDDGAGLEIDGMVGRVENHMVNVVIRRMMRRPAPFAPQEGAVSRWVRHHEVLEVIDGEPHLWPNAAELKGVSDKRDGKVKRQPELVFWTVGVDEIPNG